MGTVGILADAPFLVESQNLRAHAIEHEPIVRHQNDRTGKLGQTFFEYLAGITRLAYVRPPRLHGDGIALHTSPDVIIVYADIRQVRIGR